MSIFDFFKEKKDVVDLTGHKGISQDYKPENTGDNQDEKTEVIDVSTNAEDKKKKLVKRIVDMSDKIDDLSNQVYHLQQRIEVLEKRPESSESGNPDQESQQGMQ